MSIFELPLYEGLPFGFTVCFVFLGAILGSFFNVLAMRWPNHQIAKNDIEAAYWSWLRLDTDKPTKFKASITIPPLMSGRSHCPSCTKPIPLYRNIPIVSWLLLGGKSRCCSKPIKIQYLAFELVGALVFTAIALTTGPSVYGLFLGSFAMILCLIGWIDAKEGFVPDGLLFAGFALAYAISTGPHWVSTGDAFIYHITAYLLLLLPFKLISMLRGQDAMGHADFHLIGLAGAFLGPYAVMITAPTLVLLVATAIVYKKGLIKRGLFTRIVGENGVPAAPAIVLSTLGVGFLLANGIIS